MRITSNMMSRNLLQNLEAAQGKMTDLENMMSSGHRITKPSDDPSGVHNALGIKTNMAMIAQTKSNADAALSFMGTTDSTLGDVTSMLQRARELAVQGASDTNTPASRRAIAAEVDQIAAQIKTLANTKIGNKYIFGGTATSTEPMPSAGGPFVGNLNPIQLDVGNNSKVNISVDGPGVFVNSPAGTTAPGLLSDPQGSGNGILDKLSAALTSGLPTAATDISATLDGIDANLDNISASRATLGANVNRITAISSQMATTTINLTANLSSIQDVDIAKTIMDFQTQQNTYQAALSIGAKIIQPSLVDFMK